MSGGTEADPAALHAWNQLQAVDRLTVVAIVDNETDGMSTPCPCCDPSQPAPTASYMSEFNQWLQSAEEDQPIEMDFSRSLMAGHGLSLLLTAEVDGVRHTLLLDGGPREDLWALNASQLAVDMNAIQAVVLTHWHPDHSVGLGRVASMASRARQGTQLPDLVFDVHPDRPHRRGFRMPTGTDVFFNPDVELAALEVPGCCVQRSSEPHTLLSNTFFVSGVIPRLTEYEKGIPSHRTQHVQGGPFELDPLIMDERCVAVKVRGLGVIAFSACSHAGIVNVTRYIKSLAATTHTELAGLMGGFHLSTRACEARIPETVRDLVLELNSEAVVLAGHCTGWRAKAALAAAFPRGFQPCSVGGKYEFGLHNEDPMV